MGSFKSKHIGIQSCPFISVSSMAALELQRQSWIAVAEILGPQFSSVQSFSCVRLFATPWTAACQASLSITTSWSPPKLMSIESVMPSNHLLLCRPLLLLPLVFTSIRVFSNDLSLHTLLLLILRDLWPWIWDSTSSFWYVLTRDSLECGNFHFEAKKFDTSHAFFSPWKQVFLLCLNIKS